MLYPFEIFGVIVFAVSGALVAGRKDMDIFGVVVVAVVTALGGGTLRDLALDAHPLVWIEDTRYLLFAVLAGVVTFVVSHKIVMKGKWLPVCDAIGLALFTVTGTEKAFAMDMPIVIAVVMGMMSGVAGGILRDVLSNEVPLIFHKELYATPSLCGGIITVTSLTFEVSESLSMVMGMVVVLGLRLAGIYRGWALPIFGNGPS